MGNTTRELNSATAGFSANTASTRRQLLKMGGACGVVGAVLDLVANALHPHPSDAQLETLFTGIAQSSIWPLVHLALLGGLSITYGALLALTLTTQEEPSATLARFAALATILGGSLILVSTAMDGFAMNRLASAWYEAAPGEKATALRLTVAFDNAQFAVYSLSIVLFLGIAIFLYGLSLALGNSYPRPLGWLAMFSGFGAFVVGIIQCFGGPILRDFEVFFVIFSGLTTLWLLVIGIQMWRKAGIE